MNNKYNNLTISEKLVIEEDLFSRYDINDANDLRILQGEIIMLHSNLPDIVIRCNFPMQFSDHNTLEDLRQQGRIGMMIAVEKFKSAHKSDSTFFNYAKFWVLKYIYEGIESNRTITIPQYVALKISKEIKKSYNDKAAEHRTIQEIKEDNKANKARQPDDSEFMLRVAKDINVDVIPLWGSGIKRDGDDFESGTIDLEGEIIKKHGLEEQEDYHEMHTEFKGFLKKFLDKPKNRRNMEIYEDFFIHKMPMRQIASKHSMHHAQIANILKGKVVKGVVKAKPFVDKIREVIRRELARKGYDISNFTYKDFKEMFVENYVLTEDGNRKLEDLDEE